MKLGFAGCLEAMTSVLIAGGSLMGWTHTNRWDSSMIQWRTSHEHEMSTPETSSGTHLERKMFFENLQMSIVSLNQPLYKNRVD